MTTTQRAPELVLAGRPIDCDEAWTRALRYCGLPWDDNPPETWAFRYYDAIETDPTVLTSVDVVCAGALHPGISRDDLTCFWDHRDELTSWLNRFPVDLALRAADESTIAQLVELPSMFHVPSLPLLTKVLHRKRPWLIPVIDREVIDLYRPLTGQRRAAEAWNLLLQHLADDLRTNREPLAEFRFALRTLHGLSLSDLRTVDIVIWMGGQR